MTQGFESFLDTAQYIYTIILGENQDIFTNFCEKVLISSKNQFIILTRRHFDLKDGQVDFK